LHGDLRPWHDAFNLDFLSLIQKDGAMKTITDFPHHVIEHADMPIVMSDGCRLSARVWMPEGADQNPMPVIFEHLPYRKRDGTIARDELTHPWFAGHGYVCIRTDMRGNGDSDGLMQDEYTVQELQDAVEVIEWAAAQPWCNGKVGMMGISWGGFNGLQVAALAPKPLKAIIAICATTDRYAGDIHYKGGCLLGENFGWSTSMLSYSSCPPDPALVGDRWLEMWLHRLENQPLHLSTWLLHQHRDDYWKHGSVCEDYAAINAAVLSIGGWHDGYRNTIAHLVKNISAPVKGIVGPWIHKYPHMAGPAPAIGFLQEAKRWWDHWLKGIDTGVDKDPDYRAYLMDSIAPKRWVDARPGRWIAEQNWPSQNITSKTLYLSQGAALATEPNEFRIQVSSPHDCGAAAGEFFPSVFNDELPGNQSRDDAGSACFDSDELDTAIDIVGAPRIDLRLTCNKPQGQVTVRLCDLRPDGTSALITLGHLNLCHRDSHAHPSAVPVDEMIDITFDLDQIAYNIPQGHRLRVAVSTTYWPMLWPSPETTSIMIEAGHIALPDRPLTTGDEVSFEASTGAKAWRAEELRTPSYSHSCTCDKDTGRVTTRIVNDHGMNRDLEHGLLSGSRMKESWCIHPDDPTSASVSAQWEQTGGRDGQMWRTYVSTGMHSDKTDFFLTARVEAYENEALVFERDFKDKIPRDLV
jgi:putative CocE/NonD family hydrolase